MPTSTFYNLPDNKKEKLLSAAKNEFSRVNYSEASINRIVKEADISRGSFYMYFEDKRDLAHYLLESHIGQIKINIKNLIENSNGDIFLAFAEFFNSVVEYDLFSKEEFKFTRRLLSSMSSEEPDSKGLKTQEIFKIGNGQFPLSDLSDIVNTENLNIEKDELKDVIECLFHITMFTINKIFRYNKISGDCDNETILLNEKSKFLKLLNAIKYGVYKNPI